MTWLLFRLTLRQVLGRRSLLIALGVAAIAMAVALLFRFGASNDPPERWTANVLLATLFITTLLPLTALLFGTSALGSDIEDGTDVFLLTTPVSRGQIVFAKLAASFLVTLTCLLPAAIVAGSVALAGRGDLLLVFAFGAAIAAAALAYTAIFLMLSVVTRRALIAGLVYVFLWEGVVSGIFRSLKVLSIRQYALGIADLIAAPDDGVFSARLDGLVALPLLAGVTIIAIAYTIRRLQNYEVNEIA
jgi:ABC-2 type transport system permease protein